MKEVIEISKRNQYILIGLFLTVIVIATTYFTRNWLRWQTELKNFRASKINSRILELKDLNRGNYLMKLNGKESIVEFDLPISFEVKRDKIQVGDSLSKMANSGNCEIFRINDQGYSTKVSELVIY